MRKKKSLSGSAVEKLAKLWLLKKYPGAFIEGPPVKTRFCRRDYFTLFDFLIVFKTGDFMGVQVSKKYLSSKSREFKEAWASWPGSKLFLRYKDGEWFLK